MLIMLFDQTDTDKLMSIYLLISCKIASLLTLHCAAR